MGYGEPAMAIYTPSLFSSAQSPVSLVGVFFILLPLQSPFSFQPANEVTTTGSDLALSPAAPASPRASSCGSNASAGSVDYLAKFASLLERIQPESIIAMALRIYQGWSASPSANQVTCTLVSPPLCGSFNLIHVLNFSDGVKWILRLPLETLEGSSTTARRLESEVMTMGFIRQNTTIPIPEVISFDPHTENEITSPYIIMPFDEGTPVCQIWWDECGPTPLEKRRHKILDTVADAMSQLTKFRFNKIGMLEFEVGSLSPKVGPINVLDQGVEMEQYATQEDTGAVFKHIGPFDSSQEYITSLHDSQEAPDDSYGVGMHRLLAMMIENLPLSSPIEGKESFGLTHPDFSGQNFLVSEDGTLTAIIDWDNVQTAPDCIGCCSYPAWLTRDWDPLMYGYGTPDTKWENSPEELEGYRNYYATKMSSLGSAKFTTKSHIHEAVCIAASNPLCMYHITDKIFHHMFPEEGIDDDYNPDTLDLGMITEALGGEGLEEEVEQRILGSIKELLSLPGDAPTHSVSSQWSKGSRLWHFIGKWTGVTLIFSLCASLHSRGVISALLRWPGIINFFMGPRARNESMV